jgi:hypothetical protein
MGVVIDTKQSRLFRSDKSDNQPVTCVQFLPGETFGPSVGMFFIRDEKSLGGIEMHVDEAFNLAIELLATIRASEDKFEGKYGKDWRDERGNPSTGSVERKQLEPNALE